MRAIDLLKMCNEADGTLDLGAVKVGDQVVFAPGTELDGTVAIIAGINAEAGTVDLKVGAATRVAVPVSDLNSLPSTSNAGAPAGTTTTPESRRSLPVGNGGLNESEFQVDCMIDRDHYDRDDFKKAMKAANGYKGGAQKAGAYVMVTVFFKSQADAKKYQDLLKDTRADNFEITPVEEI